MKAANVEDLYKLSPLQQGLLFHTLYAPEGGAYFQQMRCRLRGPLDPAAFERAWQQVLRRHPALRAAYFWENAPQPMQVVYRDVKLPFEAHDWRDLAPDARAGRLAD